MCAPDSKNVLLLRPNREQLLPILNRLPVRPQLLYDLAGHVRLDLIQQFHCLDDAQHLGVFHLIADFDEGPGGAAGLARLDPDVAIWIRRIRDIPDEPPSPPARAKPRRKPAQR